MVDALAAMQEFQVVREERAMVRAVHVESNAF
jgi:hypothetical protein